MIPLLAEAGKELPTNSIIVIAVFSGLLLLTIGLGIFLIIKSKKAAEQARILNEKNQAENDFED